MLNFLIVIFAQYAFLISIFIFVLYFLITDSQIKKKLGIFTIISFPLVYLLGKISTLFIYDPRPFVTEHIKPLIFHAADNGFPSDHTLLTMAIASVIFAFNKKIGVALFVIAIIIGVARVSAGIHHPLDIIGSTVIALAVNASVYIFFVNIQHLNSSNNLH